MALRCGDAQDGHKIAEAAGTHFNPACDRVIANVTEEGDLRGGVILQAYTGASICAHMAGFDPHWANRDLLFAVFYYVFETCGCGSIFAQVPTYEETALAVDKKLGFKEEARIPDVFPGGDGLVVLRMRKEDCRWLAVRPRAEHLRKLPCR